MHLRLRRSRAREYSTDPWHGHFSGGDYIGAKDGSALYLGQVAINKVTPDPWVVGVKGTRLTVWLVPAATKPLEASLTAWHYGQAFQIQERGTQLAAVQRMKAEFLTGGQWMERQDSPPAVDITGAWTIAGYIGAPEIAFSPKGDGLYDMAARDSAGTAKVSGRTVTVEYTRLDGDGRQVSGISIFEVGEDGTLMTGAWMENGSAGQDAKVLVDPSSRNATVYKGRNGERFTFLCPPGLKIRDRLWGTDLYTHDSLVCEAGVHAGVIRADTGGTVTIEMRPGADAYTGSLRNGVTSWSWGAFDGSFVVVGAEPGPGTTTTVLPTTTSLPALSTTTSTAFPVTCSNGLPDPGEQCDDGNIVGGDCCSSTCQFETGSCDDGNVCTTAGVCSGGACQPGTPLDLEAVAGSLTGASQTPDACTGKKDQKRSRKVTNLIASAQKKLDKAAKATKEKKQQKLANSAVRKVDKARKEADKLSAKLSPECHAAIVGQVELAEGLVGCVP